MNRHLWLAQVALALAIAPVACPTLPAAYAATAAAAGANAAAAFATPDAAVDAFVDAVKQDNVARLRQILGPGSDPLISSGDPVADHEQRLRFLASYEHKHALSADSAGRMTLIVGDNDFPLPIPIVQSNGQWHFDSATGAQELIDRRIGRNEIAAIRVALAYHDAQKLYFDMMKQSGAGEYAQRIASAPGRHDGLYWPAADDEEQSPLAPLVHQALDEGYPDERVNGRPIPYQGYYFRILKAQGWAAPGGKQDYVVKDRMTKGFALVAWPARYGASGVMTFIVNGDGVVFQKDLGPRTDKLAAQMQSYNPDLTWTRVDVTP